ncbi:MAG TPA: phage tail protein, partial [Kofleriaceae bacterium]|nr:phage tail protein [Kofleriaceae bacterium]
MDINGLRSFGLSYQAGLHAWGVPGSADPAVPDHSVEPSPAHVVTGVRLASRAGDLPLKEDAAAIDDVPLLPSMAMDGMGNHVHWDGGALVSVSHLAARHGLAPRAFALPAEALPVTDIAVGDDDVLYVAGGGAVWLIDLRGRFDLQVVPAPAGFEPQRVAARAGGGAWLLDVDHGAVARLTGLPLIKTGVVVQQEPDDRLLACDPNPHPPRWQPVQGQVPADEKAVALSANRDGRLVVLSLGRAGGGARLRTVIDEVRLSLPLSLAGPRWPHALAWLDADRIALATRGHLEGPNGQPRDPGVWVYGLPRAQAERWAAASPAGAQALPAPWAEPLQAQGDYYPLAGWTGGPFVNTRPGERLHYPRAMAVQPGQPPLPVPVPVARVSLAARARYGVVANVAEGTPPDAPVLAAVGLVDTRQPSTVWHRLYLEGAVPPGCAMVVWLASTDAGPPAFKPGDPTQRARWHPHLVGERSALPPEVQAALGADVPRAVWLPEPSEVPQGRSMLCCPGEAGRTGLFGVLIQRAGLAVRSLQGPRLWATVELFGNGRETPELVMLRAYAGRLSYRDRYLPSLYHEATFGEEADRAARATGPDFLDRFLHLFEGLSTDIEGRIAASALLTDADACPGDALPWLAAWVGMAFEQGMPVARRRRMLAHAAGLARRHGTLQGFRMALDIASDDAAARGRMVV